VLVAVAAEVVAAVAAAAGLPAVATAAGAFITRGTLTKKLRLARSGK
jgi:hypothetical protein